MSIAREPGERVMVAARSGDSAINPVAACVGPRGIHPKNISRELGGDKLTIVLWSESPARFILNALGTAPSPSAIRTPRVTLREAEHRAVVEVDQETFTYFTGAGSLRVRLASRLVGWDIEVIAA
jgi:N utilization substance protein A